MARWLGPVSDEETPGPLEQAHRAVHGFVDGIGAALGIDTNTRDDSGDGARATHSGRASHAPALPGLPVKALPPARPAWSIIETKSGACIVTNGTQTAACPSKSFAVELLAELNRQGQNGSPL